MKGVIVKAKGAPYDVVSSLERPSPSKNQILVKSLATAINPVDGFMQMTGALVTSWPVVLGCDASGVVAEVGEDVKKFKVGDKVFGCTRLGTPGYSTFQEFYLMDESLTFKNEGIFSTEEAATVGVGILTAALGINSGLNVDLVPKSKNNDSEWIVIFGAGGAVGSFAVQIAKTCGFKVLGSCSPSNEKLVMALGADATFNHKSLIGQQLEEIRRITGGRFSRIFDASSMAAETGMEALETCTDGNASRKHFSTTNGGSPIQAVAGIELYRVELGIIGRTVGNVRAEVVNKDIATYIPSLEKLLRIGAIKPMAYELVGGVGVEAVTEALKVFDIRKSAGEKIVVRVAPE